MKRFIAFVLSLSMLLSMLPVGVLAAEAEETAPVAETTEATAGEQTIQTDAEETEAATEEAVTEETAQPEEETETVTAGQLSWSPDGNFPDSDELFAGYAEQVLYGNDPAVLGTGGYSMLDEGHQSIYDSLLVQLKRIAAGQRESAVIAVGDYLGNVTTSILDSDGNTVGTATFPCTPEVESNVRDVSLDVDTLLSVLLADMPYELYWFDKTLGITVYPISTNTGKVCFVFYFHVAKEYSLTGETGTYDTDTDVTGAASVAKETAQSVVESVQDASDYNKLGSYADYIIEKVSYNYSAANDSSTAYGDPWQLIWVFDNDSSTNVVCEGYAKAFQYLCDLSEFDVDVVCYNVVGTINGDAHMWNIVAVEGSSYLVDVTNCDTGHSLFLRGGTADSNGVYTVDGQKFAYREDTVALWGTGEDSILTLAEDDLTASTFPEAGEGDQEPEEEAPDLGTSAAMSGEELLAAMESCGSTSYELTESAVIDSDLTLSDSVSLVVTGSGSLTVAEGATLTVVNSLGVANCGSMTVAEGGSVRVEGSFAIGGGTTVTVDGTVENNGWLNISYGTLVINGSYTGGGYACVDQYGSVTGSGADLKCFALNVMAHDETSLLAGLELQEDYGAQSVTVVSCDTDGDGILDPVILKQDATLPQGVDLQVGYYTGMGAWMTVASGATLTVEGELSITADGTLAVEYGGALVNNGCIANAGTVLNWGCLTDNGSIDGNAVMTRMSDAEFGELLAGAESEITVGKDLVITEDVTLPAGKTVTVEDAALTVVPGVALTVEGSLNSLRSLTVEGELVLRGTGNVFAMGQLTVTEDGSVDVGEEGAIYVTEGTALSGIEKNQVCASNTVMDPDTDLQAFLNEHCAGYKQFTLCFATDYVIDSEIQLDSSIVLENFGCTVTVAGGGSLTVNNRWRVGIAVEDRLLPGCILVEEGGTLCVNGELELLHGSALTLAGGAVLVSTGALTVDEGSSLTNGGSVCIGTADAVGRLALAGSLTNSEGAVLTVGYGSCADVAGGGLVSNGGEICVDGLLSISGGWEGAAPVISESGSMEGSLPDEQDRLEARLAEALENGSELVLEESFTLLRSLRLESALVLAEDVTLTVPEGLALVNEGRICVSAGAALAVEGRMLGSLPCLCDSTAVFTYGGDSLCFSQTELENQLAEAAQTGGTVYLSIPLTLTKDLSVPAGATLAITGRTGSLTLPTERTLTNRGSIDISAGGRLTASEGGTLTNGGSLSVRGKGVLNMSDGVYEGSGDLLLCYGTDGVSGSVVGNIYESVTFRAEADSESLIREVMKWAEAFSPIAGLTIDLVGSVKLGADLSLPEYARLNIGGGETAVTLTVPKNRMLVNNGQITVGENGTLDILTGGVFAGSQPELTAESAVFTYADAMTRSELESMLSSGIAEVTLTNPIVLEEDLTVPEGVSLTVSGKGSFLTVGEGVTLYNYGSIYCQQEGGLRAEGGTVENRGWIYRMYTCDAEGSTGVGQVLGVAPEELTVCALTLGDEAIIRTAIADTADCIGQLRALQIQFGGDARLTADLTIPEAASTIVKAAGTLTVPEGITLTDESGMVVYGKLIAEGTVVAAKGTMYFIGADALVYPENCSNYIVEGLEVEAVTVAAEQETVWAGSAVRLRADYAPAGACNAGTVVYEITEGQGTVSEDGHLTSEIPGTVTVRATMVTYDSEGNSVALWDEVRVTFYGTEAGTADISLSDTDFSIAGEDGLWAGSSADITPVLCVGDSRTECDSLILEVEGGDDFVTVTWADGGCTVSVSEELDARQTLTLRVSTADNSVMPSVKKLHILPKAEAVDVQLDGQTVTGQTVLFDLNREEGRTVTLRPAAYPADALTEEAGLIQWSTSDGKIATVSNGTVTFTGEKTGKVKITMTAGLGSKRTATVTFHVTALTQEILPMPNVKTTLIGGSSTTYTVYDARNPGTALKAAAVRWYLCDRNGEAVDSHPYAAVTAAGKLTTKAVADETKVYLMAQVVGDSESAVLAEPVTVTLYPAVSSVKILDELLNPITGKTLVYDVGEMGLSYRLSWNASPYGESVKSVSWKSSKTSVATIDSSGRITVASTGAAGTVKFTLTVTAWNGKVTAKTVTMKFGTFTKDLRLSAKLADGVETEDLTGLVLYSGESITFRAEGQPEQVTTPGVKWSVSNTGYAAISSKGVLKAKAVSNPVTVVVSVKSADGACGYQIPVTVMPKASAVILANEEEDFITKRTVKLDVGEDMQIYATEAVTWISSKSACAIVRTLEDGSYRLEALAAGTAKLTAKTADGRSTYFTAVVSKAADAVQIRTKNNVPFAVASGKSLTLVGSVLYSDGSTGSKVTWSVSDSSLAKISSSGTLTAAKGITAPTTVTVTATALNSTWSTSQSVQLLPLTTGVEIFGCFTGSYPADVSNTTQRWDMASIDGVSLNDSLTLSAKTFPEGAMGVTWKSSNTKLATVDADGRVKCLKAGTVTITATAADGSGKLASFKLSIRRSMGEGTLQLPETAFVGGGKSLTLTKLTGYAIDTAASNQTLSWTLTYPNGSKVPSTVASLSKGVLKTKAVKVPVTLIATAAATDGSGETARCAVTVYPVVKGVSLYTEADGILTLQNKKTVSLPVNESLILLPDTANVKGYGLRDDRTADEYLADGEAWTVTASVDTVSWEFDGQSLVLWGRDAAVGDSVKLTLKAKDGSGLSVYVTVKFTEATPADL